MQTITKVFWIIFWGLFIFSVVYVVLGTRSDINFPLWLQLVTSPLGLLVLWFGAHYFKDSFHRFIRPIPLPAVIKFLLLGIIFGIFLGINFTISFNMAGNDPTIPFDLHLNFWINSLLYVGSWGGGMIGFYIVRKLYRFSYSHVFWIYGLQGMILEQNFIAPKMLLSGDIVNALITFLYLIPSYGVPMAINWVLMPPDQLPQGQRKLGLLGWALMIVLPIILFYAAALITYPILGAIFKENFLGF